MLDFFLQQIRYFFLINSFCIILDTQSYIGIEPVPVYTIQTPIPVVNIQETYSHLFSYDTETKICNLYTENKLGISCVYMLIACYAGYKFKKNPRNSFILFSTVSMSTLFLQIKIKNMLQFHKKENFSINKTVKELLIATTLGICLSFVKQP